jgi:RNA polymerase sigma factor (TIGR02999 family)
MPRGPTTDPSEERLARAKGSPQGASPALDRLVPLVYDELRMLAHRQLSSERQGHTLGTTALVNEAYLRLAKQAHIDWRDRAHFFDVAARMMRRILVDYARRRGAMKRGGTRRAITLDEATIAVDEQAEMVVALDEALTRLAALDERQSRVVEYRFFGGMTEEEIARLLGVTSRTVRNDWVKAKGWLYQELGEP